MSQPKSRPLPDEELIAAIGENGALDLEAIGIVPIVATSVVLKRLVKSPPLFVRMSDLAKLTRLDVADISRLTSAGIIRGYKIEGVIPGTNKKIRPLIVYDPHEVAEDIKRQFKIQPRKK